MNGHASGCTSQRRMANGSPTRTPIASASAVVACVSRARAMIVFQNAWIAAAARTIARVVSSISPRRAALRGCEQRGYALAPAGVLETTSRMRSSASDRFSRELA